MMKPREGSLRHRVVHLVMDYRMELINQRLKEIQMALRQTPADPEQVTALLQEFKDTQELRDTLARRLGSDVMK